VAKKQKNYFAECQGLALGKENILPSANPRHSAKPGHDFFYFFILPSAKSGALGKILSLSSAPHLALSKEV
jgi:hypothetical protein